MNNEKAACSILDSCERVVPVWLVLLDNIPTAVLFLLGAFIAGLVWWPLALLMISYNLLSIILFWNRICPHCHHFGTRACPCGYGMAASRLFKRRQGGNFRKIFKHNVAIMYPCWFVPLFAGVYLLYTVYSIAILLLFLAFLAVGLVLMPLISRLVGCKGCTFKDQCPWMSGEPDAASAVGDDYGSV